MTDQQADPDLWALMFALHDHCRRHNIELIAAARPLGETGVLLSRVGCNASIINLMDVVRVSLPDEGSDTVHH